MSEIVTIEEVQLASGGDDYLYPDWEKLQIQYSNIRNRVDLTEKIYSFSKYSTNADYYYQNVSKICL